MPQDTGYPTAGLDAPPAPPLASKEVGGRYRILAELGRGGCSVVYLAEDAVLRRNVALKVLREVPGPGRLERLRREVNAGRAISHPGLVRIHDLVELPGGYGIIMEAVEGPTLRQALGERGALTAREALAVHREVLAALSALHGAGFIHRDVKPENIFLPSAGGVKLGDYSICFPLDRTRMTVEGGTLGTMGYMAPEQVEGREARPASDLYAAAVVLYETLTGRRPFQGETPTQTLYAQLHHAPDPRPLREAGIPRWLRAYLKRCLARRHTERYPSAAAALGALDARRGLPAPLRLLRHAGIAAAAALAAAGGWWMFRSLAGHSSKAIGLDGAQVVARNAGGEILWNRSLEKPPLAFLSEDLDGDGEPEAVAVGGGPYRTGQAPDVLFVESDGTVGRLAGLRGLDGIQGSGGGYRARLIARDLDRDGAMEVLGYLNSVWYPTQGFVYSVRHQKVTTHFFHPGHIAEVIFAEGSGDGADGILFRAMNNALGHEGVLAAMDGSSACAGKGQYPLFYYMPGWRAPGRVWEGARPVYTFLPHTGYVYAGRTGTFSLLGGRWTIAPEHTTLSGDMFGNLDQGPTAGMGTAGRKASLEYFDHIQGMLAAGAAGDRRRCAPEDWLLPGRFAGKQPWDRVFRLVKGRELFRCGARQEGLEVLGKLAAERPLDREVNEAYGVRLFLATGDWERGAALALKDADRVLYRPDSARVTAAKIRALAGRLTVEDLDGLEAEFTGGCGQLERARILLGMGRWVEAERTALSISELSPAPFRYGAACCLALTQSATKGPEKITLARAEEEAAEYPDLVPVLKTALAVAAARGGAPSEAELLLAPVRKAAAWDLDARLYVAAFEQGVKGQR
jgi:hypothetical protein